MPPASTPTPTNEPQGNQSVTPSLVGSAQASTISVSTPSVEIKARVNISGTVRVRTAPSVDADILGRLQTGAGVTLLGRTTDTKWLQIAFPNAAKRGWVSADLVTSEGDPATLPVAATPASNPPFIDMPIPSQDDDVRGVSEF